MGGAGPRRGGRRRGAPQDVEAVADLPFLTAALGGTIDLSVDGRTLSVKVPAGAEDGNTLRVAGQGPGGGDILVKLRVQPHPYFRREGKHDVALEVPVSVAEAVLGGKVEVPTVMGPVQLTIPKASNSGSVLRLKGRGIQEQGSTVRGDQYVRLKVALPPEADDALERFVQDWAPQHPYDPRAQMKG